MNDELDEAVDFFLTHPVVKQRLDYIIEDSNHMVSSIQLVKEFKDHINEQLDGGFSVSIGDIPNHFSVFLLCSGYPIKTDNGTIKMN